MLTALLQLAVSVAHLVFGVLALWRAREPAHAFGRPVERTTWWVTGVGFVVMGASGTTDSATGVWAVALGPESWVWAAAVRWLPLGNGGRVAAGAAMGVLLILASLGGARGPWRLHRAAPAAVLLAFAGGALAGWLEGPVTGRGGAHFASVAVKTAVELGILLTALVVGLARHTFSAYLWWCLALYLLLVFVSVGGMSALAWVDVAGAWTPAPFWMPLQKLVVISLMVGLLMVDRRRLRLARRSPRRLSSRPLPQLHQ